MKKAYELSTLTGTQVLLLVASETGHVYTFATPKLQPLITKPEGKNLIQTCLNAPDLPQTQNNQQPRHSQQPSYPEPPPHFPPPQEAEPYPEEKHKEMKPSGYHMGLDANNYPNYPPMGNRGYPPMPMPSMAPLPIPPRYPPPPLGLPQYLPNSSQYPQQYPQNSPYNHPSNSNSQYQRENPGFLWSNPSKDIYPSKPPLQSLSPLQSLPGQHLMPNHMNMGGNSKNN